MSIATIEIFAARSIDWEETIFRFIVITVFLVIINAIRIARHRRQEREQMERDYELYEQRRRIEREKRERMAREEQERIEREKRERMEREQREQRQRHEQIRPPLDTNWRMEHAQLCYAILRTEYLLADETLDAIPLIIKNMGDDDPAFKQSYLQRMRSSLDENEREGARSLTSVLAVEDPKLRIINLMAEACIQVSIVDAIRRREPII